MKTRTRIRSKLRREAGREDGAAAVEFALIVGLLAMLVFGMMEYGLAFMQVQTLRAATREGARVAAVRGTNSEISAAMADASAGSLPGGFSGYSVSTTCDDDTVGESVTVTINNGVAVELGAGLARDRHPAAALDHAQSRRCRERSDANRSDRTVRGGPIVRRDAAPRSSSWC